MPSSSLVSVSDDVKKAARERYRAKWIASNPEKAKECDRLRKAKYRAKYPERIREQQARYNAADPDRRKAIKKRSIEKHKVAYQQKRKARYQENAETLRAQARDQYQKDRDRVLARIREKKYGLSAEQVHSMAELQGGLCKACGGGLTSTLAVDHDHSTGHVRGLLCRNCNLAIGLLADSSARMRAIADYLDASATRLAMNV